MIATLALLVATILSVALLRALRVLPRFVALGRLGQRSARLLVRTGVSEWAKERAMRLMAARLLARSLASGAMLALTTAPLALLLVLDRLHPFGVAPALADWPTRLLLLVVTLPALWRRHARARRAPRGERLFQRIALASPAVRDISFDIERAIHTRAAAALAPTPPIFVAGLARAGTSILLRLLHEGGDFAALSYRDLPFPLAPNLWHALSRHADRHVAPTERGHGDGLLHDLDSPEAIEEVFWLAREGGRYRQPHGLAPVPPAPDTIAAFRIYVRLVRLRHGGGRYLSKNNNNILRLPALIAAFPEARIVHPFRDPLQQAASLRQQHRRACTLAAADPYRRDFMTWLGHHEFGADQRPFLLPGAPAQDGDRGGLDHWLRLWIATYGFLLDQPLAVRERQHFLDYDALCAGEIDRADIARQLALARSPALDRLRPPAPHDCDGAHPALVRTARDIQESLRIRAGLATSSSGGAASRLRIVRA